MEKIMTSGFCELNEKEMMETNGGKGWYDTFFDFGWWVYDIVSPSHGDPEVEDFLSDYR